MTYDRLKEERRFVRSPLFEHPAIREGWFTVQHFVAISSRAHAVNATLTADGAIFGTIGRNMSVVNRVSIKR